MEAMRDLDFPTPSGVGSAGRCPIGAADREAVMDAAALLQLRRTELAAAAAQGPVPGVEITARGGVEINRWMGRVVHNLRELLSVRPAAAVHQLRLSLPNNRIAVANGLRMISVFDYYGLTEGGRALLATEDLGTYRLGVCPVQMKIFDRRTAVLQGPTVDGDATVMVVSEPVCLEAVWSYWHRILNAAVPVTDESTAAGARLSIRQRQIMSLLASDANDEAIATGLGISVRTVRSDIAEIMRILGVRSRFAAGLRFHEIAEATG